jgi:hypothetical protein
VGAKDTYNISSSQGKNKRNMSGQISNDQSALKNKW